MVFIRNPVFGKVKTRLAATVGDRHALDVYKMLLDHTRAVSNALVCDKVVYYSDFIPEEDEWKQSGFRQALQTGKDLGERMQRAFDEAFKQYQAVVIIGSDCHELRVEHLRQAFASLERDSTVIGPAYDGGYYLLGLTTPIRELFHNKEWSSDSVFQDTVNDLRMLHCPFAELELLRDIDNEQDLINSSLNGL